MIRFLFLKLASTFILILHLSEFLWYSEYRLLSRIYYNDQFVPKQQQFHITELKLKTKEVLTLQLKKKINTSLQKDGGGGGREAGESSIHTHT